MYCNILNLTQVIYELFRPLHIEEEIYIYGKGQKLTVTLSLRAVASLVSHYQELRQELKIHSALARWGCICLEVVTKMYLENGQEQVKTLIRSC